MDDANARKLPPQKPEREDVADDGEPTPVLDLDGQPHVVPPPPGTGAVRREESDAKPEAEPEAEPQAELQAEPEAEPQAEQAGSEAGGFVPDIPGAGTGSDGKSPPQSMGGYLPTWKRGARAGDANEKDLVSEYNRLQENLGSGRQSPHAAQVKQQRRAQLVAQLGSKKRSRGRFTLIIVSLLLGFVGAAFYLSEYHPRLVSKYTKPLLRKIEKIQDDLFR